MNTPPFHVSRRSLLSFGAHSALGVALASVFPRCEAFALADSGRNEWRANATALVKSIRVPTFPRRDVRVVLEMQSKDFDARRAIQQEIDVLNRLGGGRVIIPSGSWYLKGPLRITSNINLHLEEGATLLFSDDPDHYLPAVLTRWEGTEMFGYSPFIYAYHAHNVAITGKGTINGNRGSESSGWRRRWSDQQRELRTAGRNGDPVHERVFGERGLLHPSLIQFFGCSSVLVEDISTVDALFWGVHIAYSSDVTVRGIHVRSSRTNNDGVDIDSSYRVVVERCTFSTGDDCIAIKSGRDADGRFVGKPSESIVIQNCIMEEGGSAGVALGSEMSGGIRNIYISRCVMRDVETVLDLKSNLDRGGVIENIHVWDITVGTSETVFEVTTVYHGYSGGSFVPLIRDIHLDGVMVKRSKRGLVIKGAAESPVERITIDKMVVDSVDVPQQIAHAKGMVVRETFMNNQVVSVIG
jgi:polygalacturonase